MILASIRKVLCSATILVTMQWIADLLNTFGSPQSTILAAVITAMAVLLAALLQRKRSFRDRKSVERREHRIDVATKRMSFWADWIKEISPFATDEEKQQWNELAKRHLLAASSEVGLAVDEYDVRFRTYLKESNAIKNAKKQFESLPSWRRLFLIYRLRQSDIMPFQIVYWFSCFMIISSIFWVSAYGDAQIAHRREIRGITSDTTLTVQGKQQELKKWSNDEHVKTINSLDAVISNDVLFFLIGSGCFIFIIYVEFNQPQFAE